MKFIRIQQIYVRYFIPIPLVLSFNAAISQATWVTPANGNDLFSAWWQDTFAPRAPSNDATFNTSWVTNATPMSAGKGTKMSIGITSNGIVTYYNLKNITTSNYRANVTSGDDYISATVTVSNRLPYLLRVYKTRMNAFENIGGVSSGKYLLSLAASDITGGVPFVATPIFQDVIMPAASIVETQTIGSPANFAPFIMQPGHTYEFRWYVSYYSAFKSTMNLDNPVLFIQTSNIALPVTLTSFDAKIKDCRTLLTWATDIEDNFHYFEVEKSPDATNFSSIAKISSKGANSTYSYTDLNPGADKIYYRLKMVDADDSYKYSPVKIFSADCATKITVTNPVHDRLLIQGLNSGQTIIIYDMYGSVVISKIIKNTIEEISMTGKPAGVYVINVFESYDATLRQGETFKRAFRFVKL